MDENYVRLFESKLRFELDVSLLYGPMYMRRDLFGSVDGFKIHVYSGDHGNPHIHVWWGEKGVDAKFEAVGAKCIEGCESLRRKGH
ncbi:hypothetical protein LCGC14_2733610, partial [marine sediment metagenome]